MRVEYVQGLYGFIRLANGHMDAWTVDVISSGLQSRLISLFIMHVHSRGTAGVGQTAWLAAAGNAMILLGNRLPAVKFH